MGLVKNSTVEPDAAADGGAIREVVLYIFHAIG